MLSQTMSTSNAKQQTLLSLILTYKQDLLAIIQTVSSLVLVILLKNVFFSNEVLTYAHSIGFQIWKDPLKANKSYRKSDDLALFQIIHCNAFYSRQNIE